MTTKDLASAYLEQARAILEEARAARAAGRNALAVRRSQESVEFALKAVLRACGVEVPRLHDVGEVLAAQANLLPEVLRSRFAEVSAISERLAEDRIPAFYGDEKAGIPPEALFGEESARGAVADAERVFSTCEDALAAAFRG